MAVKGPEFSANRRLSRLAVTSLQPSDERIQYICLGGLKTPWAPSILDLPVLVWLYRTAATEREIRSGET